MNPVNNNVNNDYGYSNTKPGQPVEIPKATPEGSQHIENRLENIDNIQTDSLKQTFEQIRDSREDSFEKKPETNDNNKSIKDKLANTANSVWNKIT